MAANRYATIACCIVSDSIGMEYRLSGPKGLGLNFLAKLSWVGRIGTPVANEVVDVVAVCV